MIGRGLHSALYDLTLLPLALRARSRSACFFAATRSCSFPPPPARSTPALASRDEARTARGRSWSSDENADLVETRGSDETGGDVARESMSLSALDVPVAVVECEKDAAAADVADREDDVRRAGFGGGGISGSTSRSSSRRVAEDLSLDRRAPALSRARSSEMPLRTLSLLSAPLLSSTTGVSSPRSDRKAVTCADGAEGREAEDALMGGSTARAVSDGALNPALRAWRFCFSTAIDASISGGSSSLWRHEVSET